MSFVDHAKRAARAVWSGPFAVGPLVQPISLGAALLRTLEVCWKFAVAVLAAVLIVGGAVASWLLASGKILGEKLQTPTFEAQLIGRAKYSLNICTKDHPIAVIIKNISEKTLRSASINLVITIPKRSTNLNLQSSLQWDLILPPKNMDILCFSFPDGISDDPKKLVYSVNIFDAVEQN